MPAAVAPEPVPVPVLPAEPDPLPPEAVPFGLVGVQNSVLVVWPAGSVGRGFIVCGKQVGETPGVSASAGAAVWITAIATIGAAPRAATYAISLRITTPPKWDGSTLAAKRARFALRAHRQRALQLDWASYCL